MVAVKEIELDSGSYPAYGRAVHCPQCRSPDTEIRRTCAWDHTTRPPTRTRYHGCKVCDRRFKTVELGKKGKRA